LKTSYLIISWRATRKLVAPVMNEHFIKLIDTTILKLQELEKYEKGEADEASP